jgi:hypothetical protein
MKWPVWIAGLVAAGGLAVGSAYTSKRPESVSVATTPLAPSSVQAGSTLVDCGQGQNVLLRQANGVTQVECVPGATMASAPLSGGDFLQPIPVQANVPYEAPVQVRQASYEPRPATRTSTRRVATRGRTWKKSAAIIGGATAAGAGVGAILDGGSGAKKGAVVGLVGGVVYDVATRNR